MKTCPASARRSRHQRRGGAFTLLEILIVFVVIGLVMAVAAPAIVRQSDRMTIEGALTDLRTAVSETALRARATGQTLTLTLDAEAAQFRVGAASEALERTWQPPQNASDDLDEHRHAIIEAKPAYRFPSAVQWQLDDVQTDDDGQVVLTFFPDGQAAARELPFDVCGRRYLLQVDRITASPVILELIE